MKRKSIKALRYIAISLAAVAVGLIVANAVKIDAEADDRIRQIDQFITSQELCTNFASYTTAHTTAHTTAEPETVSLSYAEWKEQKNDDDTDNSMDLDSGVADTAFTSTEIDHYIPEAEPVTEEPDIYAMDVWTLGSYLYGISELDTTRSLILISYEAYGPDSPLSYYVACACWARTTNGYLGSEDLYASFGGLDPQYGPWMDGLGWDAYAEDALRNCYLNPMYITGCNGVDSPAEWIYAEDTECGTIYVW